MTDVMKMSRKAFSIGVVALTVAWSIGLSALLAPLASSAAVSGSLIKASMPAVYYMGSDGKRYVFPNEKTYFSWYADFSAVQVITDSELASLPIGGNVTYRPGVRMVKIQTDPKVYAVDSHGVLRWITSEAAAVALYGSAWNTMVHDVSDAFFTNYTVGADVSGPSDFNPGAATAAATSINQDKNLSTGSAAGLSVSKASDSPMGATLPLGAMGVNFVKFNVMNGGSSAAMLSSLTVMRSGPGYASDFDAVYVYRGSERLTTGRSINSSSNEATFSGLNLSIPAGGSVSLWIAGDISTSAFAGNVNALSVSSVMVGSSSVSGTPVMGSSFSLAGATVGEIDIERTGGSTLANIKAGGLAQRVASFRLTAGNQEDLDVHSVALTFGGNLNRAHLSNFVLKQSGSTLASIPSISDKDLVTFAFSSPMFMEKGAQRTFDVFADVNAGARSGDEVAFYVDVNADVRAMGRTYGFGVMTTIDATFDASTDQVATVEAGKLTTTFNGPASKDVLANGKDVELFNFTVAAQANLEFREVTLALDTNGGDPLNTVVSDIKIVDTANGAIVAGPTDGGASCVLTANTGTCAFSETWNLASGQSRTFKVTADINSAANGDEIRVTLGSGQLFANSKVRNLDNNTYLGASDMVPSTVLGGNIHTVTDSGLTVGNASTPVAQTYIKGSSDIALAGWSFTAADAAPVRLNSITVDCTADDDSTVNEKDELCNSVVQTVRLMNGATQVGVTASPDSSDSIRFDNLNLTINGGQSMTLVLMGTLSSSAPTTTYLGFEIEDVDVTDADGGTVSDSGVPTAMSALMTVAAQGSVTLVNAPVDIESEPSLVIGGSSNVVLGKYRMTAQDEELRLSKVQFSVATPAGISTVSLHDGATLVGGPVSVVGGLATFSSVNFVVPKDTSKTLTVKANLNTVSPTTSGPQPMDPVTITMLDANLEIRGTSAGSGTTIVSAGTGDPLAGNLAAYGKFIVKSKPTVEVVSGDKVLVNSAAANVLTLTVSADTAGPVAFQTLEFTVNDDTNLGVLACSGTESSVFTASNNQVVVGNCDLTGSSLTIDFTDEQVVNAGTAKSYYLMLNISGTADGDSVSVVLESTGFGWSDYSAVGHDTTGMTGADWFTDGDYVKYLPSTARTLSR